MASNLSKRLRDLDSKPKPKSAMPPMPGQRSDDDDRPMDSVVFFMMSLTALVAIVMLAVIFGTKSIESGLENRILKTLQDNQITDVEVRATGRDVLVVGEVPEADQIEKVIAYVNSVPGVISAETNLRVAVAPRDIDFVVAADPIIVTWGPAGATVTGTTSTQDVLDAIVLALNDELPGIDTSGLSVREGTGAEREWLSTFFTLAAKMPDLTPEGTIFVSPDDKLFQVTAEFETRRERAAARQEALDIVSATTFEFTSALTYKDAPPPPKVEQVIELQENIDELIEGKIVEFETNSDVITPAGRALLDEIIAALNKFPDVSIEIAGHTDDQGSDDYNLDLSRRRADSVLAYLVSTGQPPERFVVVGYGESRPLVDNATAEGRARNRRIEFKALLEG